LSAHYPPQATTKRRESGHRKTLSRYRFDRRTRTARRAKELAESYCDRLGDDASDPLLSAAIVRAAEPRAVAEHLRARAMQGAPVSADDVVRMERLAKSGVFEAICPQASTRVYWTPVGHRRRAFR
jgi:hypothetical protein